MKFQVFIKLTLSILFLVCLLQLPYGYYEFVRFLALIGFSILAFYSYEQKENKLAFVYIALAILFQPLFKIALGRTLWNIVDVIVAAFLLISLYRDCFVPRKDK